MRFFEELTQPNVETLKDRKERKKRQAFFDGADITIIKQKRNKTAPRLSIFSLRRYQHLIEKVMLKAFEDILTRELDSDSRNHIGSKAFVHHSINWDAYYSLLMELPVAPITTQKIARLILAAFSEEPLDYFWNNWLIKEIFVKAKIFPGLYKILVLNSKSPAKGLGFEIVT